MDYEKYSFNKICRSFLEKIENDFGRKIRIVEKELGPAEHGFSKIEDVDPVIEIGVNEGHKKELIIHEAYHLRLRYDGMPSIGFDLPTGSNTDSNRFYLKWFTHLFWDKINHHFFYPSMKEELGLDPYESFKRKLEGVFRDNEIKNLKDAAKEIALAGYYLQTWVETQDESFVERFEQFLRNRYDGLGLDKGIHLVEMFKENPLASYEDCVRLFIKVLDYIHSEQGIKIRERQNTKEQHENYIQQMVWLSIGAN